MKRLICKLFHRREKLGEYAIDDWRCMKCGCKWPEGHGYTRGIYKDWKWNPDGSLKQKEGKV